MAHAMPDFSGTIFLLGDSGVGKTSLALALTGKPFPDEYCLLTLRDKHVTDLISDSVGTRRFPPIGSRTIHAVPRKHPKVIFKLFDIPSKRVFRRYDRTTSKPLPPERTMVKLKAKLPPEPLWILDGALREVARKQALAEQSGTDPNALSYLVEDMSLYPKEPHPPSTGLMVPVVRRPVTGPHPQTVSETPAPPPSPTNPCSPSGTRSSEMYSSLTLRSRIAAALEDSYRGLPTRRRKKDFFSIPVHREPDEESQSTERMRELRQHWYSRCRHPIINIVFICFALDDFESLLAAITFWRGEALRAVTEFGKNRLKNFCAILVGCKAELRLQEVLEPGEESQLISIADGIEACKEAGYAGYYEASALEGGGDWGHLMTAVGELARRQLNEFGFLGGTEYGIYK